MKKDKQLKIRVNTKELETIKENAARKGVSVSEYIILMCTQDSVERVHNNDKMCTQSTEQPMNTKGSNVYTQTKKQSNPVIKAWSGEYSKTAAAK